MKSNWLVARIAAFFAVAIVVPTAGGCDDHPRPACPTGSVFVVVCSTGSSAKVTLSTAPVSETALDRTEGACDTQDCADGFRISFLSESPSFSCTLTADKGVSIGQVHLPNANISFNCSDGAIRFYDDFYEVSEGTLTITTLDKTSVRANVDLDITRKDSSATGHVAGTLSIDGCHDADVCTL